MYRGRCRKLNQNLDGLQVTLARANDLLNDRNRANIASSLSNVGSPGGRRAAQGRPSLSTI